MCTYKFNFPESALLGDLMYLEISQLANVTAHVGLGENLMAPGVVKCPSLEQKNVLVVRWPTPMSVVLQSTAKAA